MSPNALSKSKLQFYKGLKLKKNRNKYDLHIIEGIKLVLELCFQRPKLFESIICTNSCYHKYYSNLNALSCPVYLADDRSLKAISQFKNPSPIIGICHKPKFPFIEEIGAKWLIYLNNIQDPGNLGTIIRTADWFGMSAVVTDDGCADLLNGKTIQASMGSYAKLPSYKMKIEKLQKTFPSLPLFLMDLNGTALYNSNEKLEQGIYVLGSEGQGISSAIKAMPHELLMISGAKNKTAESLNVASAAAILFYAIRARSL